MTTPQYAPGSPADDEFDAWVAKHLRNDPDGGRETLISQMIEYGYDRLGAEEDVAASIARLGLDQQPAGGDDGIGETSQESPERETSPDVPLYDEKGRLVLEVHDHNPIDPARDVVEHLLERNESPRLYSIGPKAAAVVTGTGQISPLDEADWLVRVASLVTFMGMSKQGPVTIAPPAPVMRMVPPLLVPRLDALDGVTSTPYISSDGVLVTEDGYNPGTRLILRKGDLELPSVSDVPSEKDVARAKELIETEWLGDFCWAGTDRANAIALLLTVTGRPLFSLVPMFVIDASVSGAGKGLFVSTLCQIAMGKVPQFIELPSDKEEQRKKITTALLNGQLLIAWDEAHVIGGHTLAMTLTAETYGDRLLGGNKMMSVTNNYVMAGLGNNVQVVGDMKRRVIPARLVPDTEHPEHKTGWRHDPLPEWVKENRGELLWAALVIWKNWMASGRPEAGVTMGSFERFARTVGGALEAAGITGFLGSSAGWLSDSGDEDAAEWAEHLARLRAVYGDKLFTAKDVVRKGIELPPFRRDSDEPPEKQLGYQYRSVKERWLDDLQLVKTDKLSGGRAVWRVVSRSRNTGYIPPISSIAPSQRLNQESRHPEIQDGAIDEIGGMVSDFPERESSPDWAGWYYTADLTAVAEDED